MRCAICKKACLIFRSDLGSLRTVTGSCRSIACRKRTISQIPYLSGKTPKADPNVGVYAYHKSCKRLGTPPQRKVEERLTTKEMDLRSRVLGTIATRAITTALTVSCIEVFEN
jgi:hypothetical protein